MLAGLAWRNIWRQPHRTFLSVLSIALGSAVTIFILALQLGGYGAMKENVLRLIDGYAQIQPPGYAEEPDLRKTIAAPDALMDRLDSLPAVTASAPRATTYVILTNGPRSYGAALYGVVPNKEAKVSTLGSTIVMGRYLDSAQGEGAIVMGAALARNLKLDVGGTVTMIGSALDGSIAADVLKVVGIFSTGTPDIDRQVVEMPLAKFQADFGMENNANVVAVAGNSLSDIDAGLPALRAAAEMNHLVVRDWADLEPALRDVILLDISFSLLLYASLVVIVVFIILNTLLMSVLERTHEFGMLMAIGMRPSRIGAMVWLELIFLAGIGDVFGIALGAGVTRWLSERGIAFPSAEALFRQWHMPATLHPTFDLTSTFAGPAAIAVAICIAGFVPYARIRGLEPVSAMRAA